MEIAPLLGLAVIAAKITHVSDTYVWTSGVIFLVARVLHIFVYIYFVRLCFFNNNISVQYKFAISTKDVLVFCSNHTFVQFALCCFGGNSAYTCKG